MNFPISENFFPPQSQEKHSFHIAVWKFKGINTTLPLDQASTHEGDVLSLNCVWLFTIPCTVACQAPLTKELTEGCVLILQLSHPYVVDEQCCRGKVESGVYTSLWFPYRTELQLALWESRLNNQRRRWHPIPILLSGKSHGQRSLVCCSPWGHEESDTTEWLHFHFHALEKEMATHSSVLAWRIPGMAEPGGLPSRRLHRVGHDWRDLAATAGWIIYLFSPSLPCITFPLPCYYFLHFPNVPLALKFLSHCLLLGQTKWT